jgi:hypothetical protein
MTTRDIHGVERAFGEGLLTPLGQRPQDRRSRLKALAPLLGQQVLPGNLAELEGATAEQAFGAFGGGELFPGRLGQDPAALADLLGPLPRRPTATSLSLQTALGGSAGSTFVGGIALPGITPGAKAQRRAGFSSEEIDPSTGDPFIPELPQELARALDIVRDPGQSEEERTKSLIELEEAGMMLTDPGSGQPLVPFTHSFIQQKGARHLVGGPFAGFLLPFQGLQALSQENVELARSRLPENFPGSTSSEAKIRRNLGFPTVEAAALAAEADPLNPVVQLLAELALDPANIAFTGAPFVRGLTAASRKFATSTRFGRGVLGEAPSPGGVAPEVVPTTPTARGAGGFGGQPTGARATEEFVQQYPSLPTNATVDGRVIRDPQNIPNMASIEATLGNDYDILPGLREVRLAEFDLTGRSYSKEGTQRIRELGQEISQSNEITPLIVVVNKEGAYILEGATRAEALQGLGAKSFPAKVVIDRGTRVPQLTDEAGVLRNVEDLTPSRLDDLKRQGFRTEAEGIPRPAAQVAPTTAQTAGGPEALAKTAVGSDTIGAAALPSTNIPPSTLGGAAAEAATQAAPSGIQRALTKAAAMVHIDEPGAFGRFLENLPGVNQVVRYIRPANKLPKDVQIAYVAERGAVAEFATVAFASRRPLLSEMDTVFGKGAARGGKVDVPFVGTADDNVGIVGTILDIAQRPQLYVLTDEMAAFLARWQERNQALWVSVQQDFGVPLGQFPAPPGGVFLSNVDVSDDVIELLGSEARAVVTGRAKTRVFDNAAERMKVDPDFVPETDMQRLLWGMDESKAWMAGHETFVRGSGGLTRMQAVDITNPGLRKAKEGYAKRVQSLRGRLDTAARRETRTQAQLKKEATKVRQAQRRADPIHKRIDELDKDYGPELSFLSGQLRELHLAAAAAARRGVNLSAKANVQGVQVKSLLTQLNEASAQLATLQEKYAAANIGRQFKLVQEDVFRYFPNEVADDVRALRQGGSNIVSRFLEEVRGTAFAGDLSPIAGIQLPLYAMFSPKTAIQRLVGAGKHSAQSRDLLRSFRSETLAKAVNEDLQGYRDLAFWSGQQIASGVPQEFTSGLLRKIPGFTKANEGMFSVLLRAMKSTYDNQLEILARGGVTGDAAKVVAADMATKVTPLWNPSRLGLSSARAAALRSIPTSVSFLIRPAALVTEAATGFSKLVLRQSLSPQEQLAVRLALTYTASTEFLAITTASISALLRGDDPWLAATRSANPLSSKYGDIIIGDRRIPLGGPYRSIIRLITPSKVDFAPVPLPFANVIDFGLARTGPALQAQIRLLMNRDFQDGKIRKGHGPEQVLRALAFEAESMAPLTIGAAISGVRRELRPTAIAEESAAQFLGSNIQPESPFQARNVSVRMWAEENQVTTSDGSRVESYFDLGPRDRQRYDAARPDSAAAIKKEQARQVRQGIPNAIKFAQLDQATTNRRAEEAALVTELRLPSTDPKAVNEDAFRDQYAEIQKKAAMDRAATDRNFQIFQEDGDLPDNPNDRAVVQYYNAFDEATSDSGRMVFELLDSIMRDLKEEWTPAQEAWVEANTGIAQHEPLIQEFLDDRDFLAEAYFKKQRDKFKERGLLDTYQEFLRIKDEASFLRAHPFFAAVLATTEAEKVDIRTSDAEVDGLLYKWGYIDDPKNGFVGLDVGALRRAQGGIVTNRQALVIRR